MNHNQQTRINSINFSSCKFGVKYQNQFVVLYDAKHFIGVDASDLTKLIFENIYNRKADKFELKDSSFYNYITTLVYDEDTGSLYSGDRYSNIYK